MRAGCSNNQIWMRQGTDIGVGVNPQDVIGSHRVRQQPEKVIKFLIRLCRESTWGWLTTIRSVIKQLNTAWHRRFSGPPMAVGAELQVSRTRRSRLA